MKNKQPQLERRYQFLKFQVEETGKFVTRKSPLYGLGEITGARNSQEYVVPITQEVAVIFDKETGKVEQVEVVKLFPSKKK